MSSSDYTYANLNVFTGKDHSKRKEVYCTRFVLSVRVSGMVCGSISPYSAPWATRWLSQWSAALVVGEWQHRRLSFPLHPFINAKHGTGQAASTVCKTGKRPSLRAWTTRAQPTAPLGKLSRKNFSKSFHIRVNKSGQLYTSWSAEKILKYFKPNKFGQQRLCRYLH